LDRCESSSSQPIKRLVSFLELFWFHFFIITYLLVDFFFPSSVPSLLDADRGHCNSTCLRLDFGDDDKQSELDGRGRKRNHLCFNAMILLEKENLQKDGHWLDSLLSLRVFNL